MLKPRASNSADGGLDLPKPARWLGWMARIGYVAEGLVYVLIGGIALVVAFEPGQLTQGSAGALAKLGDAPLGEAMLTMLAAGLAAFVLWQSMQAFYDPLHRADRWTAKRLAARLGCLLNAVLHALLVGDAAVHILTAGGDGHHGQTQAQWTQRIMQLTLGRWAVALTGVGIVVFGLFQFYRAATGLADKRLDLRHTRLRIPLAALGIIGVAARGVVFSLIGGFLVHAAWRDNAAQATGIAGALSALRSQAYGLWLLGAVATGLIAYGLFQMSRARFASFLRVQR